VLSVDGGPATLILGFEKNQQDEAVRKTFYFV
jgi:hypothetical protein